MSFTYAEPPMLLHVNPSGCLLTKSQASPLQLGECSCSCGPQSDVLLALSPSQSTWPVWKVLFSLLFPSPCPCYWAPGTERPWEAPDAVPARASSTELLLSLTRPAEESLSSPGHCCKGPSPGPQAVLSKDGSEEVCVHFLPKSAPPLYICNQELNSVLSVWFCHQLVIREHYLQT